MESLFILPLLSSRCLLCFPLRTGLYPASQNGLSGAPLKGARKSLQRKIQNLTIPLLNVLTFAQKYPLAKTLSMVQTLGNRGQTRESIAIWHLPGAMAIAHHRAPANNPTLILHNGVTRLREPVLFRSVPFCLVVSFPERPATCLRSGKRQLHHHSPGGAGWHCAARIALIASDYRRWGCTFPLHFMCSFCGIIWRPSLPLRRVMLQNILVSLTPRQCPAECVSAVVYLCLLIPFHSARSIPAFYFPIVFFFSCARTTEWRTIRQVQYMARGSVGGT